MKYLLDTDIVIYFMKNLHGLAERIAIVEPSNLYISIITYSELLFGAYNSTHIEKNVAKVKLFTHDIQVLPFCEQSAEIYAEEKALLKKKGSILADLDLMIAGIALRHNYTLVTNNTKHFQRIKNLKLVNWCK